MPANRKEHTVWVENLFLEGKQTGEISEITGLRKNVVTGIIYRGRQNGRIPRPVYTQAYDDRRGSYIRRGTISHVISRLSRDQHKHLTETALEIGCESLAEIIAAYVVDQLAEEMSE
jgi:hypothetical protein